MKGRPWSAHQIRRLRKLAEAGHSANEIAKRLRRPVRTVRAAAAHRGIVIRVIRTRVAWTQEMDDHLRAFYATSPTAALAEQLGVATTTVYGRAHKLGLLKSREFLSSPASGRKRAWHSDQGGRFLPGNVPWSAGTKGIAGTHPNCRAHQFRPGNMTGAANYNFRHVGSLRISKDGQLCRKVRNDGPARSRWVPVARLVWEATHGTVPRGHVVRFRDGQATTDEARITLDRLECISQRENMRRNSCHTILPPEAAKAVQLRGAINRRIRNLERKIHGNHL